jgi:hypothetical protein
MLRGAFEPRRESASLRTRTANHANVAAAMERAGSRAFPRRRRPGKSVADVNASGFRGQLQPSVNAWHQLLVFCDGDCVYL